MDIGTLCKGLWIRGAANAPMPEDAIRSWELQLGFAFPKAFSALCAQNNGGELKRQFFQRRSASGVIEKTFVCEALIPIGKEMIAPARRTTRYCNCVALERFVATRCF